MEVGCAEVDQIQPPILPGGIREEGIVTGCCLMSAEPCDVDEGKQGENDDDLHIDQERLGEKDAALELFFRLPRPDSRACLFCLNIPSQTYKLPNPLSFLGGQFPPELGLSLLVEIWILLKVRWDVAFPSILGLTRL